MPITAQEVLQVVQSKGPIIPNTIKQALQQTDTTMINVYLSQLKEEGKIKFTNLQLGTSMFAYTQEQTAKLEELQEHLNEKDRRTAQLLKEKHVLQASKVDPLTRVSLQEIKDFAKPIKVTTKQGDEIFYRYFLTTLQEAQEKIRQELTPHKETQEKEEQPVKESAPVQEEIQKEQPAEQKKQQETVKPPQPKPEEQTSLQNIEIESEFGKQVQSYCTKNDIKILSYEELRKESEIELTLNVPTAVGNIHFFAKARNKKSSNDGDLAAAILKAKTKNLPALYITTGNVTNKALEQPELQDITVIEIGS